MTASQKSPGKERQKENKLRLARYKKVIEKPPKLEKTWVLKMINRKVGPAYGLSPIRLIRFCDNLFPVDSSVLSTKQEHRHKFYPIANRVHGEKRVLKVRNCQEKKFCILEIESKWLPPGQFGFEMQNLKWYMNW
jgi:hypothetical protein